MEQRNRQEPGGSQEEHQLDMMPKFVKSSYGGVTSGCVKPQQTMTEAVALSVTDEEEDNMKVEQLIMWSITVEVFRVCPDRGAQIGRGCQQCARQEIHRERPFLKRPCHHQRQRVIKIPNS